VICRRLGTLTLNARRSWEAEWPLPDGRRAEATLYLPFGRLALVCKIQGNQGAADKWTFNIKDPQCSLTARLLHAKSSEPGHSIYQKSLQVSMTEEA
jgi:hypothetical protein